MVEHYLEYELQSGYSHNWLIAGPAETSVEDLDRFPGEDFKTQIAQHYYHKLSEIHEQPVERGTFQVGDQELTWRYYRCADDHLVDVSAFYHTCHHLRSWAYTQVHAPEAGQVSMVLTTNGPADLWINGRHVHRQEHFHHQDPHSVSLSATLKEGWNEVLVRFEEVAARECPYAMALQIVDLSDQAVPVRVPTDTEFVGRHVLMEELFDQAHIESNVMYRSETMGLHWLDDLDISPSYSFRLEDWRDRIYMDGSKEAKAGETTQVATWSNLEPGQYYVSLQPQPEEYYVQKVRYRRRMPLLIQDVPYVTTPYGTYQGRRKEALEFAATRRNDLYAEIAKYALGRGATADGEQILEAIEGINQRRDCSDFYLVGLLGLAYRHGDSILFPKPLREALKECILGFKYWHDEPGADAMCYTTENHSILFHACEILAGQRYPDETFTNTGKTGQWHREKGERLALEWLRQRGTTGFTEWDSNCYFDEDILALAHLHDLAESLEVREMSAIVMDKMLLTMALNSFRGVFGSTHGRTYTPFIKGSRLEATSGIARLLWGMGVWNDHIRGLVGLASSDYELPTIIAAIAADTSEMWHKEQHPGVNKVTYRTADYMLCSAQDLKPGEKGYQQHIWQATLGPDAVTFVTHPPCMSQEGSHRPNFWHGNYVLPRVAQYKDTLIAVHNLPNDDWMGFTHAYFPAYAFDEYALDGNWAFACKGSGYLALYAAQGLELTRLGDNAYQELRSYGSENIWLCLMGRAETDGSFADFQKKVRALNVKVDGLQVTCDTLRGQTMRFGWEGPLLVDGESQPLSGFKHYDGPFCSADMPAEQLEMQYGEYILRLHFEATNETEN